MGIAGFFLWLARLHGECIDSIDADGNVVVGGGVGITPRSDAEERHHGRKPSNAHGRLNSMTGRYDNLYLDMNGLIHPCCHDTAPLPEPESEEEMFSRIFDQVDKLVALVKPSKCLFMAIDGVAPRSKMNQQRSRRFRAAEERQESLQIAKDMSKVVVEKHHLPPPTVREKWDHNVITPSTAFMERIGQAIEWYIIKRLNDASRPEWRELTVILSDAHVPGEGEHKIMHQIRALRAEQGYDPRTSHLIHGLDADLICLGLSTHEPNVGILRNVIDGDTFSPKHDEFCIFNVRTYRQSLRQDFNALPKDVDFERVIDDFVFLCFFIGNDFLPHMPLVDIKCKGLENVLDHYVRAFSSVGFLTKNGVIYYERLRVYLEGFISHKLQNLLRLKDSKAQTKERAQLRVTEKVSRLQQDVDDILAKLEPDQSNAQEISNRLLKAYADVSKEELRFVAGKQPMGFEYGQADYRDEYYRNKLGWQYQPEEPDDGSPGWQQKASAIRDRFEECIQKMCAEYLRGCQWVLRYYTRGCPSWEWYYPFHYAPLLQDVTLYCRDIDSTMRLSEPLHPIEQLLAVLPRESVTALPEELHQAVLDESSVLAKFYPKDLTVDFSEATFSYQGVVQLPFINATKLRQAIREVVDLLPDEGYTLIFAREGTDRYKALNGLVSAAGKDGQLVATDASIIRRLPIAGRVGFYENAYETGVKLECPDHALAESDPVGQPIEKNVVQTFAYEMNLHAKYLQKLLHGAMANRDGEAPRDGGHRAERPRHTGTKRERGDEAIGGNLGDSDDIKRRRKERFAHKE